MKAVFTKGAERDLKKLDKQIAGRIGTKIVWFYKNFSAEIPQPLGGNLRGFYKLRVGDWRVIYAIDSHQHLLVIHLIDHRNKIYKK